MGGARRLFLAFLRPEGEFDDGNDGDSGPDYLKSEGKPGVFRK